MSVKTTTPNYLGFRVRMNPGCDFCAKSSIAIVRGAFCCEDHEDRPTPEPTPSCPSGSTGASECPCPDACVDACRVSQRPHSGS